MRVNILLNLKTFIAILISSIIVILIWLFALGGADKIHDWENKRSMDLSASLKVIEAEAVEKQLAEAKSKILGQWRYTRPFEEAGLPNEDILTFTQDSLIIAPTSHDTKYRLMLDTEKQLWLFIVPRFEADESSLFQLTIDDNTLTLNPITFYDDAGIKPSDEGSITRHKLSL